MKFDFNISDLEPIITDEDIRVAKNAYARKWRKENPEKQKRITMRYRIRKAAQMKQDQDARDTKE